MPTQWTLTVEKSKKNDKWWPYNISKNPNEVLEEIVNDGHMILEHNPLLEYDDLELKKDEYFTAQEDFGLSESDKDMIQELPLR